MYKYGQHGHLCLIITGIGKDEVDLKTEKTGEVAV